MKKILCIAVFFCIAMTLSGAPKTRCRNCGIGDGNIIFMCEKQHITCSKCARGRNAAEALNDQLVGAFSFGYRQGSSMRCTKVNRYDKVCDANITRKIADNRSPEMIRREQALARQKAERAAQAKAAQEQREQAGINVLRAEHKKLLAGFSSAIRGTSAANLKKCVANMLAHHDNHDGYASKKTAGIFGMFGGRSGGEKCDILDVMVTTALKLNDERRIAIILANINPGDDTVLAGLKTGKIVYVNLFAGKLKKQEVFSKAIPVIVATHSRLKNPAYITAIISALKTSYTNVSEVLLDNFLAQKEKLPFAALKPLYDAIAPAALEKVLTQAIVDKDAVAYRYLIDKRKAKGTAAIRKNDLAVYPYHLLIANKDFAYAQKVKISPTMHEDELKVWKGAKRDKGAVPVVYMAEINNFEAVKYLIEKEEYEFGTFSNYTESNSARTWAKKHKNKEMYKYLDDKISGWTTAGYFTGQVLLLPVYILVLLVAR